MVDRGAAAKFEILRQIHELARVQREALELDNLDRFQQILDEREELISQLRVLSATIDESEASGGLPENVIAFPRASDASAEDGLAIDTVIRGILEHDRHNETVLAEKMDEIREALPALTAGHRATAGYRVVSTTPSFIDRTS